MRKKNKLSPETISVQAMHQKDSATGGVTPGIHPSTTFARDENYELLVPGHSYSRDENPGYVVAENVLCELESASVTVTMVPGIRPAIRL